MLVYIGSYVHIAMYFIVNIDVYKYLSCPVRYSPQVRVQMWEISPHNTRKIFPYNASSANNIMAAPIKNSAMAALVVPMAFITVISDVTMAVSGIDIKDNKKENMAYIVEITC